MSDRFPFSNWPATSQPTFAPFGSTSAMTGPSLPSFTTPLFNVPENHPASGLQNASPSSSSTPSNPFAHYKSPSRPAAFGPSTGFAFTAVQLQPSAFSRTSFPEPATTNSGDFVFPRHPRSYRTRPPTSSAEMGDDVMEPMNRDAPVFQNQPSMDKQRTEMEVNYMKDVFPKEVQSTFQSSHLRRTPSTTWTGPPQTTPAPDPMQDADMEMDGIVETAPEPPIEGPPIPDSSLPFPIFGGSGWAQSSTQLSGTPQPFQSSFFGSGGGVKFSTSSPFGVSPGRSLNENPTPINFSATSFPSPFGNNQSAPSFTLNSLPFVFRVASSSSSSSGQQSSAFGEASSQPLTPNQGLSSSPGVFQFGAGSTQTPFGNPSLSGFQTPRSRNFDSPLFEQASSTPSQGFFGSGGSSLETSYAQRLLDHQLKAVTGSAPVTGFFASPNTSISKTHVNLFFGQHQQTPEQTILKTKTQIISPEQRILNMQNQGASPDQSNLTMQNQSNLTVQDQGFRPDQMNPRTQSQSIAPVVSWLGSTPLPGLFQSPRQTPERTGTVQRFLMTSSPSSDAMTPEAQSPPFTAPSVPELVPELVPVQPSEAPITAPVSLPTPITAPEEKAGADVPLSETTEITEETLEPISEEVQDSETDTEMQDASPNKHLPDSTPDSTKLPTEIEPVIEDSQAQVVEDVSNDEDGGQLESLEADQSIIKEPISSELEPPSSQGDKSIDEEGNTEGKSVDLKATTEEKSVGQETVDNESSDQEAPKEDNSIDPELTEEETKSLKRAVEKAAVLTNAQIIEEWTHKVTLRAKRNREIAEAKVLEEIRREELHRAKRMAFDKRLTPAEQEYTKYEQQLQEVKVHNEQLMKGRTFRTVDRLTEEQVEELLPTVEDEEYYFAPNIHILKNIVCGQGAQGLKRMYHFVIGRKGYGKVEFDVGIDITKMKINKVLEIQPGMVQFLKDMDHLKKMPMTVTLYNVHLEVFSDVYEKTRRKVRKYCRENGHEFVSYDREGTWVFRIDGSK